MNELLSIFLCSGAMFVGCYFAGMVPLLMALSERKLRFVTVFGSGLLVGTALAVIIPEGIEALSASTSESHSHLQPPVQQAETRLAESIERSESKILVDQHVVVPFSPERDSGVKDPLQKQNKQKEDIPNPLRKKKRDVHSHEAGHTGGHAADHTGGHGAVGFSLVCGFILMLIIDQMSARSSSSSSDVQPRRRSITATIGLVVHAAADGIALGAATSSADIQIIVFVAIMLHKAPAAFGLVSFLLSENVDRSKVKKHLLAFSSAAPIAALLTYAVLGYIIAPSSHVNATGLLLLFSAGTFLYVATVHVLPEIGAGPGHSHAAPPTTLPNTNVEIQRARAVSLTINELVALCVGALTPAFLAIGHSH